MSQSARPVCGASTALTKSSTGLELSENPASWGADGSLCLVSINIYILRDGDCNVLQLCDCLCVKYSAV